MLSENFPFTECNLIDFEEDKPFTERQAQILRSDLRTLGDSNILAKNRVLYIEENRIGSEVKERLISKF